MVYPGDVVPFLLPIEKADGSDPAITAAPVITLINTYDDEPVKLSEPDVTSAEMTLVPGTLKLYKYLWHTAGIAEGVYVAVASWVAAGVTVTNRYLATVRLGDSRVTSEVAKEATTAKQADTAKDATVLHQGDFIAPKDDITIQAIWSKISGWPALIPSQDQLDEIAALVTDLHDVDFGTWTIEKDTVGQPKKMTLQRVNGNVLQVFNLTNTDSQSQRARA